ncbi:MAG: hypothetical protein QM770_11705 [Tepidisphaeraceae bacterium]
MPRLKPDQVPSYRLHRQSGQAIVTLCGRDFTLGLYGTPDSRRLYHELVAKWEAAGRKPIHLAPEELRPAQFDTPLTVDELCTLFDRHAREYYKRPDGTRTSEPGNYKLCLGIVRDAFGQTAASAFTPSRLREVRNRMVKRGWVRKSINLHVRRIRHAFKWAVSHELIPAAVHQALTTVEPLKAGRSTATETEAQGRIHTSAATVAVLPELADVKIDINPKDIEEFGCRGGGPGGQNVNKVETGWFISHKPSGLQFKME